MSQTTAHIHLAALWHDNCFQNLVIKLRKCSSYLCIMPAPKAVITKALDRDFTRVGKSPIAGKGVFAKRKIPKGSRIIEYKGKRRKILDLLAEQSESHRANPYIFHLHESVVIDGATRGNDARFINHSCEPNCEAYTFDDRVYIYASRDIRRGEELTFDYQLRPALSGTEIMQDDENYRCNCGSARCRGTMLLPCQRLRKRASQ